MKRRLFFLAAPAIVAAPSLMRVSTAASMERLAVLAPIDRWWPMDDFLREYEGACFEEFHLLYTRPQVSRLAALIDAHIAKSFGAHHG